jgi:hypothetical protein
MDIWLNIVIIYMAFAVFNYVKNGFYYMVIVLGIISWINYCLIENKALALFISVLITNFICFIYMMYDLWEIGQRTPGGIAAIDPN